MWCSSTLIPGLRSSRLRRPDRLLHLAHGALQTDEDGAGNDAVTDVQFLDAGDADGAGIIVKAEGGALPLIWLVDGVPIDSDPARREAELPAGSRGFLKLSVIDAKGRADRVSVRVR